MLEEEQENKNLIITMIENYLKEIADLSKVIWILSLSSTNDDDNGCGDTSKFLASTAPKFICELKSQCRIAIF